MTIKREIVLKILFEMEEHLEIKVTLKTCLPVVLGVLCDLLRDEFSGHDEVPQPSTWGVNV